MPFFRLSYGRNIHGKKLVAENFFDCQRLLDKPKVVEKFIED